MIQRERHMTVDEAASFVRLTKLAASSTGRPGYTLLEVILAMAIAIMMLAALYVALDVQLRDMQEGRDRVEKSTVARALFNRISSDLSPSLGPIAPLSSSSPSASGGAA